MGLVIKSNGVELPSPTEISTGNEILWSSNTGRSTNSGKMLGDIVAKKDTLSIKWEYLTRAERQTIIQNMAGSFFEFTMVFDGVEETMTCYRAPIQSELLGYVGGVCYYKSVTCELVEQ